MTTTVSVFERVLVLEAQQSSYPSMGYWQIGIPLTALSLVLIVLFTGRIA
jgi:hypothetical protein